MSAAASDQAPARIVVLANQIAVAFQHDSDAEAATAGHIAKFWESRMRAQLKAAMAAGGIGLNPVARAAAERLGLLGR